MRQLPAAILVATLLFTTAQAQTAVRREIARTDIAGSNKEMVLVKVEVPPSATSPRHTHPGAPGHRH